MPAPPAASALCQIGLTRTLPLAFGVDTAVLRTTRLAALPCRQLRTHKKLQLRATSRILLPSAASMDADGAAASGECGEGGKSSEKVFFIDQFALRQWTDPQFSGTRIEYNIEEFVQKIEEYHAGGSPLVGGYAEFCKHIFVPNFVGARANCLAIDNSNLGVLRSGYRARTPSELPVLTRWFPKGSVATPAAKMLDVILYSREQLELERAAMGHGDQQPSEPLPRQPWGIISVKAQDEDVELPMQPITMMRNSLGREEGGSGVPLDRAAYAKAVDYWEKHANIME